MSLEFTVSELESIAFTEHFYKESPSHQRMRNRTRWALPLLLLPVMFFFNLLFGFSLLPNAIFLLGMVAWYFVAPRRFDGRVKRYAEQQMRESSYAKGFGKHVIQIDDDALRSEGPTGQSTYKWDAVDRVVLTDDFLFIFLAGPMGFPISVKEVGTEQTRLAHNKLRQLISKAKTPPHETQPADQLV